MLMVLKKAFLGEIQPFTWCVEILLLFGSNLCPGPFLDFD